MSLPQPQPSPLTPATSPFRNATADWSTARRAIIARVTCADVCKLAGIESRHDRYPCPNPEHKGQSRGPDLTFNRDSTGWRCHACNAGGSVFDLAVHLGAASGIGDAIRVLGALAGVELPATSWRPGAGAAAGRGGKGHGRGKGRVGSDAGSDADSESPESTLETAAAAVPSERAAEIRRRFATVTQSHFTPDTAGAEYLESRSIPWEAAKSAGVGWVADPTLAERVLREKYTPAELRAAGLISRRGRFFGTTHRLVIADRQADGAGGSDGTVMALRSIAPSAKPKEIACGRGVFGVGSESARERLALHRMWVWCEGTTDWLTAWSLGFAAIGVPGAGQWRYAIEAIRMMAANWPSLISDLITRHVIAFDSDEAGQRGARQFGDALRQLFQADGRTGIGVATWQPCGVTADGSACKDLNDCVRLGATADELRAEFAGLFNEERK